MKPRPTKILVVTLLSILAVFAFAGCSTSKHNHSYDNWTVTQAPSCETAGAEYRKCSCGVTEERPVSATGHSYGDYIAEIPATCVTNGVKGHYECSVCHKQFDKNFNGLTDLTVPTQHNLGFLVLGKEATCNEKGSLPYYRCLTCRKTFTDETCTAEITETETPSLEHEYGTLIVEKPATFEENGWISHYHCLRCNGYFNEEKNQIDSIIIPKNAHTFSKWIAEIPETCATDGVKGHYSCSDAACVEKFFDANYDEMTDILIPATGHLRGAFVERKSPTCIAEGNIAYYHCSKCNEALDETCAVLSDVTIQKIEHSFGDLIEETPASCTSAGCLSHYHCSACNKDYDTDNVQINATIPLSHSLIKFDAVKATCITKGKKAYFHCKVCENNFDEFGKKVSDVTISALGHKFTAYRNPVQATCLSAGSLGHKKCEACNKYFDENGNELSTVSIPIQQHTYSTSEPIFVQETCTEKGTIAHFHCTTCNRDYSPHGEYLTGNLNVEPLGHKYDHTVYASEPTCTTDGNISYSVCSECSRKYPSYNNYMTYSDEQVVSPALAHSHKTTIPFVDSTCDEEGTLAGFYCIDCNLYFNELSEPVDSLVIEEKGHQFGDWIEEKEATETELGVMAHKTCRNCNKHFNENGNELPNILLPTVNHNNNMQWQQGYDATCNEDGMQGYYFCTHCNKYFDKDFNEFTEVTDSSQLKIPATHVLGEIIPAVTGTDCLHPTVKTPYRKCNSCGEYFDENGETLYEEDIFEKVERHAYKVTSCDQSGHTLICSDCNGNAWEIHSLEYEIFDDAGEHYRVGTCNVCNYVCIPEHFTFVEDVTSTGTFYVGYSSIDEKIFEIYYLNYNYPIWDSILSANNDDEARRFCEFVSNLNPEEFDTAVTETFTLTFYNLTKDIEITFIPYELYGLKTLQKEYMKGYLYSVNDLEFYLDDNQDNEKYVYPDIVDDGGFDHDYDFDANGVTKVTFTLTVNYEGIEYTVDLIYSNQPSIMYMGQYDEEVVVGNVPEIEFYMNNHESINVPVSQEIIEEGEFDANTPGKYSFTVKVDGVLYSLTVTVIDTHAVNSMFIYSNTILIGENVMVSVWYYDGYNNTVVVTPDMITGGTFDNTLPGEYRNVTITYGGFSLTTDIYVRNPEDRTVESIEIIGNKQYVWESNDGKLVPSYDFMYFFAYYVNGEIETVHVTADMVSYSQETVDFLIATGNNRAVDATLSYGGKTQRFSFIIQDRNKRQVKSLQWFDSNNLSIWTTTRIAVKNGDFSAFFVSVNTENKYSYFVPLTKEMILFGIVSETGLTNYQYKDPTSLPSDLYNVKLTYGGYTTDADYSKMIVVYTENDIEHSLVIDIDSTASFKAGTRESVFAQLSNVAVYYQKEVDGDGYNVTVGVESLRFEELTLGNLDNIDFSCAGPVSFEVGYNGCVTTVFFNLIPDMEGVEYLAYDLFEYDRHIGQITVYDNGYALSDNVWYRYSHLTEDNNIIVVGATGIPDFYATVDEEQMRIYIFTAENRGGVMEEYFIFDNGGLPRSTIRVFTKDGISLADVYSGTYYTGTVLLTFEADGKHVVLDGARYLIDGNNLIFVLPDCETIYTYIEQETETDYAMVLLMENGQAIVFSCTVSEGVTVENLIAIFDWQQNGNRVSLSYEDVPLITLIADADGTLRKA